MSEIEQSPIRYVQAKITDKLFRRMCACEAHLQCGRGQFYEDAIRLYVEALEAQENSKRVSPSAI